MFRGPPEAFSWLRRGQNLPAPNNCARLALQALRILDLQVRGNERRSFPQLAARTAQPIDASLAPQVLSEKREALNGQFVTRARKRSPHPGAIGQLCALWRE